MIFFKDKKINSIEFDKIMTDVIYCQKKIEKLESSIEVLKTNNLSLRGLVNRKLGGLIDAEDSEDNSAFPPR